MDPDFRDFVLSPVLSKPIIKRDHLESRNKTQTSLEDIYQRLLQHLKKGKTISKDELKGYLEQTNKMNSDDPKNHWFLTKIKNLVNYILKKRSDFQCSMVEGHITMYERSASEQSANSSSVHAPQEFHSQPNSDSFHLPSNFLTNENFFTIPSKPSKLTEMEVEISHNYSEDLFPDTIGSLYNYSKENYEILKTVTNNQGTTTSDEKSGVFKVPHLDKVFKIHEKVEENYNSLFSLTQSMSEDHTTCDINMENTQTQNFTPTNFDDLTITNDKLKEEFDGLLEYTENWVTEIANNLIHLEVTDHNSFSFPEKSTADEGKTNASSVSIETQHSEENLKILREVCGEFKKNLEQEMKSNKKLEIFKELLISSNLSKID